MTFSHKMWPPLLLVASSLAGPQLLGGADPCRPQAAGGQGVPVPDEVVLGDHWLQLFAKLGQAGPFQLHLLVPPGDFHAPGQWLWQGPPSSPFLQPGRPNSQQQLLPALPWQERRVPKQHVTEAWEHKHQEKVTAIHGEEGEAEGAQILCRPTTRP